jgi:hypothetical protein
MSEMTETNNGWISVIEQLPAEDGAFLVQLKNNTMEVDQYCPGDGWRYYGYSQNPNPIIAWHSLPEPYKSPHVCVCAECAGLLARLFQALHPPYGTYTDAERELGNVLRLVKAHYEEHQ